MKYTIIRLVRKVHLSMSISQTNHHFVLPSYWLVIYKLLNCEGKKVEIAWKTPIKLHDRKLKSSVRWET